MSPPPSPALSAQTLVLETTPPRPRRKILKPPHGRNRGWRPFVRVEHEDEYVKAKELVKTLLPEELDILRSWGRQDENKIRRFISKVLVAHPIFARYDDAWPILYYGQQILGDLRRPLSQIYKKRWRAASVASSDVTCVAPASRIEEARERRDVHVASPPSMVRDIRTNTPNTPRHCPRGDAAFDATHRRAAAPLPPAGRVFPLCDGTIGAGPSYSAPTQYTAVAAEYLTPGEQEVLDFLLALGDGFGYLLDRFRLAGITSKARLLTLARWASTEKMAFLRNDVRLSAFERKVVSDRLTVLVTGGKA